MTATRELISRWLSEGVPLNSGATESRIAALQARFPDAPGDLLRLLRQLDGMADGLADAHGFSIWSCERIVGEGWTESGEDRDGPYLDWAIADVLIDSHYVCVRSRPRSLPRYVVPGFEADFASLEDLFQSYLSKPETIGAL